MVVLSALRESSALLQTTLAILNNAGWFTMAFFAPTRLTSAECLGVFDCAVAAGLTSTPATNLVRHPSLIDALQALTVTIRS